MATWNDRVRDVLTQHGPQTALRLAERLNLSPKRLRALLFELRVADRPVYVHSWVLQPEKGRTTLRQAYAWGLSPAYDVPRPQPAAKPAAVDNGEPRRVIQPYSPSPQASKALQDKLKRVPTSIFDLAKTL